MKPMEQLWLEHYYYPGCKPLKNIMRLPQKEAFALAKELSDAHPETTAFYRFKDFENYYPARLKTDRLLYDMFCQRGGLPQNPHPLSFVLGTSEYLHHWFGSGEVLRIPLSAIAPETISFTFGNSMSTLARDGILTMLTLSELLEAIQQHPDGAEGYLKEILKQHRYIEAQVWGDVSTKEETS